jgi:hypothetical protein
MTQGYFFVRVTEVDLLAVRRGASLLGFFAEFLDAVLFPAALTATVFFAGFFLLRTPPPREMPQQ